ncbi:hypothetical protein [Dysosmobacter sp.]|uniref:hypothetical protein n=1 Tax=Dysosmobacter sp. TaxID=2591382 RepID=UPI003A8DA881
MNHAVRVYDFERRRGIYYPAALSSLAQGHEKEGRAAITCIKTRSPAGRARLKLEWARLMSKEMTFFAFPMFCVKGVEEKCG